MTPDSQILYDRDPRERVQKVAPYLTLDGRVYPAVVDGRVKWIIDGYTTTDQYPYSASRSLDAATTDSLTETSDTIQALQPKNVNYIRNSVKATVDAYDGSVTLYAWDAKDPILKAWSKTFPTSLKPISEIDGATMSHLRYPEDLFKVQRNLLTQYHVTDSVQFFSGNDFWNNPDDPTSTVKVPQPPYYLTLKMPDQDAAKFSLMSTFIPRGENARNVMTGYLAVDADAGNEAGKPSADYGKLRLLELPRDSTVPGPGQMNNNVHVRPDRLQRAEHPRPRRLQGRARQPADAARRRRAAVRPAGLRPGRDRAPRTRRCSACSSASATTSASRTPSTAPSTRCSAATRARPPVMPGPTPAPAGPTPDADARPPPATGDGDRHRHPTQAPGPRRPDQGAAAGATRRSRTARPPSRSATSRPTARRRRASTRPSTRRSRQRPAEPDAVTGPADGGDVRDRRSGASRFGRPCGVR